MVCLRKTVNSIAVRCADPEDICSSHELIFATQTNLVAGANWFALIVVLHTQKQRRSCRKLCHILMSGNVLALALLVVACTFHRTTNAASIQRKLVKDAGLEEITALAKVTGD